MDEKLVLSYIECNYEVEKKFDTLKEIFNYIEFYNVTHSQQLVEFIVEKETTGRVCRKGDKVK